jgi:flagellar biosynthesis/type III secretory pathway M-ring protein FliF/YscJ
MNVWETVQVVQRPAITVLALLLAFVVALKVIRALRSEPAPGELLLAGAAAGGAAVALSGGEAAEGAAVAEGVADEYLLPPPPPRKKVPQAYLNEENPLRQQVVQSVEEHPEVAARLVRAWLKEP